VLDIFINLPRFMQAIDKNEIERLGIHGEKRVACHSQCSA
jgi:hypothetical protein